MDIHIQLARREPPVGTITSSLPAGRAKSFEGWIEMVGAIYELLLTDARPGADPVLVIDEAHEEVR